FVAAQFEIREATATHCGHTAEHVHQRWRGPIVGVWCATQERRGTGFGLGRREARADFARFFALDEQCALLDGRERAELETKAMQAGIELNRLTQRGLERLVVDADASICGCTVRARAEHDARDCGVELAHRVRAFQAQHFTAGWNGAARETRARRD